MELQQKISWPPAGTYVLAVSGGVDSVVLLDLLACKAGPCNWVVAHFDHGMRQSSDQDRRFVAELAKKYNLPFEYREGKLGPETSEGTARCARYTFLESVQKKHRANGIVTAHHLDDRIETLLLNLERGTGRYGLAPFNSSVIRPLRYVAKQDLVNYAKQKQLIWREDQTNSDTRYRRNYIRHKVIPKLFTEQPSLKSGLTEAIEYFEQTNLALDAHLESLVEEIADAKTNKIILRRHKLIILEPLLCRQLLYYLLRLLLPNIQVKEFKLVRLEHFCKTARPGKRLQFETGLSVISQKQAIIIELTVVVD